MTSGDDAGMPRVVVEHSDETEDASRRTRLANERTYLAWWRSGLTAIALGIAAGTVVADLTRGSRWPYEAVGIGFALSGMLCIIYGFVRHQQVDRAMHEAEFPPADRRALAGFTIVGVALGCATLALLVGAGR